MVGVVVEENEPAGQVREGISPSYNYDVGFNLETYLVRKVLMTFYTFYQATFRGIQDLTITF